jgi:hypothetical protein
LLVMLIGCGPGSAAVPVTEPVTEAEPEPRAPSPDARLPEPDARPPDPVAVIENVLVAGTPTIADVTTALQARTAALAACLSADGVARTTELSIGLGEDGATALRVAWQDGTPIELPCLTALLAVGTADANTHVGAAYAVVRSGHPGVEPPPAPTPPDRKAEVKMMFCDLFTVSGADKEPVETRAKVAQDYARAHVRHPAPLHIAAQVWLWSPAERADNLVRAVKAEGIKRCALQRF